MTRFTFLLSCLLAACGSANAYASAPLPDAGRIEEQLNLTPPSQPRPAPSTPPAAAQASPLPGAETTYFLLRDVRFTGATVDTPEELRAMAAPLLGREVAVADLYRLAARLTDRYRQDGYVVAQAFIPPQAIQGGVITIAVLEPYVDDVTLTGEVPPDLAAQMLIAPWRQDKLMNVNALERTLLLLNDLPGVRVQSVLEPQIGNPAPGAMVLRLIFAKEPAYRGRVSFDNYGSNYIGPYQAGGGITLSNAFGHMAETDIQAYVATQMQELMYGNLAHRVPLPVAGLTANFGASYSRVVPGGSLDLNDIESQSRSAVIGLTQSLIRSRELNLSVAASLETRSSVTKTLGVRLSEDQLTVAMLESVLENADRWGGVNSASLRVRQGLDWLGARETGSLDLSRAEGESDFTSVQAQVSRLQDLNQDWSVFVSLRGQYASGPLLSSEEFGYGGNAVGRGYNASEIVGDRGLSGLVEARYRIQAMPNLDLSPYAFYDLGKVWNIDTVGGEDFSGASTGFGVRGAFASGLSFDAMLAQPLTRRVETPQYGDGKSPQFRFSVEYRF